MSNKFFDATDEKFLDYIVERLKRLKNVAFLLFLICRKYLYWGIGFAYLTILRIKTATARWVYYKRRSIARYIEGYRSITLQKFLELFPPDKNCSKCHGAGVGVATLPSGFKELRYCKCVQAPYQKSGKLYYIKQPKK